MRDLIVTMLVLGILPFALRWPHVGIMGYAWLSYMNPHRLTWGFAHDFPFAQAMMAATLTGWLLSGERRLPRMGAVAWVLLLFALWVTVTSWTAKVPLSAWLKWDNVMKMMLVTFLTLAFFGTQARLRSLVWVITLSIGFFGIKGGLFTLLSGGGSRVWGPPSSFIEDNNALALALAMVTPLYWFLAQTTQRRPVRLFLLGCMGLTVLGVLGTYSRGGALALLGMAGFVWLGSRNRIATGTLGVLALAAGLLLMPGSWFERMNSTASYEEDPSVTARFRAWEFAMREAAERPILGGGFKVFELNTADRGANGEPSLNAHSIYFEVLGEHGWPGLLLFLTILAGTLFTGQRVRRLARGRPELGWAALLAQMLQTGVIGYALGGAFLTLGFFDLYYHLAAVMLLTWHVACEQAKPVPERLGFKAGPFPAIRGQATA